MTGSTVEYLFITSGALLNLEGHGVTARAASARLGSLAPTRALTGLGYDARTCSIAADMDSAKELIRHARHVVFGEIFTTRDGLEPMLAKYRELLALVPDARKRAVFSIADDHFDDTVFSDFYAEVLPECRAVVVMSDELSRTVARFTQRPVFVAPEPYEGARGTPQVFTARAPRGPIGWLARRIGLPQDLWRMRLLWFGYAMNLPPLMGMLPALDRLARRHPMLLTLVTRPFAELPQVMTPERSGESSALQVRFREWQPNVMDAALAAHDVVLIPSAYRDPVKQAKSPNRLVAGLHAGRLVVAHPLRAYAPYADFAWIGEDLCAGIEWAIRNPRDALERIARGQVFIDQRHSPEVVARFWLDVFDRSHEPEAAPAAS
jgi:hypothetical protein